MKINIYLFLFVLFFSFKSYSSENDKIVFLNINYVFNNSVSGKEANLLIQNKIKKLEEEVKKFSEDINKKKKNLVNQKNILSKEEFDKKFTSIDNKIKEFNEKVNIKNREIQDSKKKIRSFFIKELRKILSDYSTENSIKLIIKQEDVLIGSKDLDISNDILKIVDKNKIKLIK